ncbi:MAG: trimeric intracellular cation channel family protein [Sphingobacteriales bacterium]|nr:MAG: trimeric intracellular cation channel family protein [Sphingobacteriales bacterium]
MQIQYYFELIGTAFFAVSGALVANEKSNPDWFGATFIGFVTAIGGGSLRDILLGSYPLVWIGDVSFVYAILVGIIAAKIFFSTLQRLWRAILLFDALGIAMFTIIGTEKALHLGADPFVAAIMGMFTAVMGGVIRDLLTNEVPVIFLKEIYATACFTGALLYLLLDYFNCPRPINFFASGAFIVLVRVLAIKFNLGLPKFRRE